MDYCRYYNVNYDQLPHYIMRTGIVYFRCDAFAQSSRPVLWSEIVWC